jgi:protein TonB
MRINLKISLICSFVLHGVLLCFGTFVHFPSAKQYRPALLASLRLPEKIAMPETSAESMLDPQPDLQPESQLVPQFAPLPSLQPVQSAPPPGSQPASLPSPQLAPLSDSQPAPLPSPQPAPPPDPLPVPPPDPQPDPLLKNTLDGKDAPFAAPPLPVTQSKSSGKPATSKRGVQRAQRKLSEHLFYPTEAVERGLEGTVYLILKLADDGSVLDVRLASSSGHPILDNAAIRAAYAMGRSMGGEPGELMVPVTFQLQ